MAVTAENPLSFWQKIVRFLIDVIEVTETLADGAGGKEKKAHALDLVDKWYRTSGITIPYLPGPLERLVVRRIASGLIDGLVDLLNSLPQEGDALSDEVTQTVT